MSFFSYVNKNEESGSYGDDTLKVGKIISHVVLGIVTLVVVLGAWAIVPAGERGIVLRLGEVNRSLEPGPALKIPILERVIDIEVRTQKIEVGSTAASKDLQIVTSKIALNYNLDPDAVADLYEEVGLKFKLRIIDPAIQESVKAATAKFNAEELITQREIVKEEIERTLRERLALNNIEVSEVSIVDFDFSTEFNNAIEAKVTAEQRALEAENKLKQVEFEAQQKIETAKAEAESIRIQAQAITQQGGKDYVNLQWIEAWKSGGAQVPDTILGTGGTNYLFNLNK